MLGEVGRHEVGDVDEVGGLGGLAGAGIAHGHADPSTAEPDWALRDNCRARRTPWHGSQFGVTEAVVAT